MEEPLASRIPAGDDTLERHGHDRVVRGFDRCAEQLRAAGLTFEGGLGLAMPFDLALEGGRVVLHLGCHSGKGARQLVDFATRPGRHGHSPAMAKSFDRRCHLHQWARQRARDGDGQQGREQDRRQTSEDAGVTHDARGCHQQRVRHDLEHRHLGPAGQPYPRNTDAHALAVGIGERVGRCFIRSERSGVSWEVALPSAGRAELECEFLGGIRTDQVIAAFVDDIETGAGAGRRANFAEDRPHIDSDDDDAERLAVRRVDGGRHRQDRHMRRLDRTVVPIELDRRDVDFVRWEPDRSGEIVPVTHSLQLGIRNNSDRPILARSIDANDLASAVVDADDTELRIGGFGRELGRIARCHAVPPSFLRRAVDGIDAAAQSCAHNPVQRHGRAKTDDVGPCAADIDRHLGAEQTGVRLDAFQGTRQSRRLEIAVGQPADGDGGDDHQPHHCDGQAAR